MANTLTIGYITVDDPHDRRTWSGSNYYLMRALERAGAKVVVLGPLRPQPILFLCRLFNKLSLLLVGKRFHYRDSFIIAHAYKRILERRLKGVEADLLIAPAGLAAIAYLRTPIRIVHINDRSIRAALEYHVILKDLFDFSREQSLKLEQEALFNASLTVYASEWAAVAAREAFPTIASRMHVIPMGANLEHLPPPPTARAFPTERLKLLMIGVDWENKGGQIAYNALMALKRRGYPAQLVVCGCDVPEEFNDPDLVVEGFLSKEVPEERAQLEEHLRTADFFILPTRFEAYGIAFCEAAAYGIPALGTRTGGVPTIVRDGETGFLLDPGHSGAHYADRIQELVNDPARWQIMRTAARQRFDDHFTWDAFVRTLFAYALEDGPVKSAR